MSKGIRPTPLGALAVLGLLLAAPAAAWFEAGHMVVAKIAHDRLTPHTRAEADRLIGVLADFAPVRADFISASIWLDDIKAVGWNAFDRWHYINLPINAEGLERIPSSHPDHAVQAVSESLKTLQDERAPDLAKAFSLRVLIHVAADLHQPLHCVNRFTRELPEGDRGGNDFLLAEGSLHLFWDDAGGLFEGLDLSSPSANLATVVEDLLTAVPEEALPERHVLDPGVWAQESHRLATTVAYVGVMPGREPSESYRIRAQLVAERRLVIAGYRLAAMLEEALGSGPRAESKPAPP